MASVRSQGIRPPRQLRSRRTLEALFRAAEALVAERGFNGTALRDVLERAGCAVGTFYARFPNREVFFEELCLRYYDARALQVDEAFAPERWSRGDAAAIVRSLVENTILWHRDRRALIRAVVTYTREQSAPKLRAARRSMNRRIAARVTTLLLAHRSGIRHPDPALGVRFALHLLWHYVRETVLFAEELDELPPFSTPVLTEELTRALTAYLGIDAPSD